MQELLIQSSQRLWNTSTMNNKNQLYTYVCAYMCLCIYHAEKNLKVINCLQWLFVGGKLRYQMEFRSGRKTFFSPHEILPGVSSIEIFSCKHYRERKSFPKFCIIPPSCK